MASSFAGIEISARSGSQFVSVKQIVGIPKKVPIGFLKYLKGHDHVEHVVLKRAGKKWLVKLNGRRFKDGWEKFAEEHDLQLGDMLIFRHEGDMDFDVSIFDSTRCDTEYAEYLQEKKIGELL
ncbi:hypothetical protein T459_32066 [Capsicum annuum]|uniref:TF-B3 domain-containing protein n=1 Tax=Capsicum annuum TaxID=4072 RepID=A0A2G2Y2T4_CAPAN|nr:hypothetical protein T459_32066 [Capsicum annuum]